MFDCLWAIKHCHFCFIKAKFSRHMAWNILNYFCHLKLATNMYNQQSKIGYKYWQKIETLIHSWIFSWRFLEEKEPDYFNCNFFSLDAFPVFESIQFELNTSISRRFGNDFLAFLMWPKFCRVTKGFACEVKLWYPLFRKRSEFYFNKFFLPKLHFSKRTKALSYDIFRNCEMKKFHKNSDTTFIHTKNFRKRKLQKFSRYPPCTNRMIFRKHRIEKFSFGKQRIFQFLTFLECKRLWKIIKILLPK